MPRFALSIFLGILLVLSAALPNSTARAADQTDRSPAGKTRPSNRRYRSGGFEMYESANFRLCCRRPFPSADQALESAETLRRELMGRWNQDGPMPDWAPKCELVLHPTAAGYLTAVPGGTQTVGSTLVDFDRERVSRRRIDVRADRSGWLAGAVAHELTHLILVDMFPQNPLARWADEGIAVLADPPGKREAHRNDLLAARNNRTLARLAPLLLSDEYPPSQQAAFYGQSASLVEYLLELGGPAQLIAFLRQAQINGYERALRDAYAIQGVAELERRWRQRLELGAKVATRLK